jgi:hypothetical protein
MLTPPRLLLLLLTGLPGAQVRIRGVAVGSVLTVRPSLDKVDVLVEVGAGSCGSLQRDWGCCAAPARFAKGAGMHGRRCDPTMPQQKCTDWWAGRQTDRLAGWLRLCPWHVFAAKAAAAAGVLTGCVLLLLGWAHLQVNDTSTVIPRNSVIEANQSGLIAEPLIDITPQLPLPTYT